MVASWVSKFNLLTTFDRFVLQPVSDIRKDLAQKLQSNEEKIKSIEVQYIFAGILFSVFSIWTPFTPRSNQQGISHYNIHTFVEQEGNKEIKKETLIDLTSELKSKETYGVQ